jgi:hypothetical protein
MKTVGTTEAARMLGISPALLRYRALQHKVRVHRTKPMLFRIDDLLAYKATMPRLDARGSYSRDKLSHLLEARQ